MPSALSEKPRDLLPPAHSPAELPPRSLFEQLGTRLKPKSFFVGVILGFIACSVVGFFAPQMWPIQGFQRFHRPINDSTDYFPTSSQMLAIVRNHAPHDKILVLIGGGSVCWGFGQSPSQLWSDKLQKLLGESYAVVNLSLNGHGAFESSSVVFEKLRKEYRRAIFVTSGTPIVPLERTTLRIPRGAYLFYDALFKGYMDEYPTRMHPPIPASQRLKVFEGDQRQEAIIAGALDSLCRFGDLWNGIGYKYFFTVWTTHLSNRPWDPRNQFVDDAKDLHHRIDIDKSLLARVQWDVKNFVSKTFYANGRLRDRDEVVAELQGELERLMPPDVRPQVISFLFGMSPAYLKELSPSNRRLFELRLHVKDAYRRAGYNVVDLTQHFQESDYCDAIHLTPDGGQRFATAAADAVRQTATSLGYTAAKP